MSGKVKKVIIVTGLLALVAGGIFTAFQLGQPDFLPGTTEEKNAENHPLYTCPMHPTVVQEAPGTCPICKMDLVPMAEGRGTQKEAAHPPQASVEASGKTHDAGAGDETAPIAFDEKPAVGTRAKCPVMGNVFEVNENTLHSEYLGKHYVFCCPGCKPQFDADPERYLSPAEDEVISRDGHAHEQPEDEHANHVHVNGFDGMPPVGTKAFCPVMQNDFTVTKETASSEYQGKTYVFCCAMCKPIFDKNPERYVKMLGKQPAAGTASPEVPSGKSGDRKIKYWVAPMDPTYIRDEPGKSPMGMDLVPVYEDESAGTSDDGKTIRIDPVVVQNMGVRVAKVTHGPIFRHVRTIGEVEVAEDEVSVVNLRFNGWIERIFVDETGQKVKRGQPLFNVYSPELMAAQEEYLLAVRTEGPDGRLARSAARRMELWGIGPRYLKRIASDGKASKTLTIYAPRSGYVLHKNVVLGAHVNSGADLYRIGDLDRIWVNTEVYEYDAPWISVGQPASIELTSQQGKAWEGTVSYVYPTLNRKSRTLRVRLEFENPGIDLKPGMLAIVRIETRRKDHAVTVPSEAVLHSGERRIVFVVRGYGKYEPREVVTGLVADNHKTEILEGLTKGEEVVVSGQFLLDSESQLQEAVSKLLAARLQSKKKGQYQADDKVDGKGAGGDTYWTCGMHPEVVQDGPGTCPKCGMDLVEKKR